MLSTRLLSCTTAALLAAAISTTAAAAANPSSTLISPALQKALERDLGINAGDVPNYLAAERTAMLKKGEVQRQLDKTFAGVWLERDTNGRIKLVAGATQPAQTGKARALGVDIRVVPHSLSQLEAAITALNRTKTTSSVSVRRGIDPNVYSWHVDLPANRIVVTAAHDHLQTAVDFVAASGIDSKIVRFETSKAPPTPTFDIRGGDRYWTPMFGCSIGFSAYSAFETGFATAGHCGTPGTTVSGANYVAIGDFGGSTFPGADHAWVRNTNPGSWTIQPLVNTYDGGNLAVVGNLETPVGGATCRSGATTGWRCGAVTATNVTVNYAAGLTYGLTQSTACVGFGDSGGSFVSPGGEAQGVTSGGGIPTGSNDNCAEPSPVTFHQPIQPLLNAYGLVLHTAATCGRLNPGGALATNASLSSCGGRFVLVMQGDGNLVLYDNTSGAALWASSTFGAGFAAYMQTDGNLVIYTPEGLPVWASNTSGLNGAMLFVQDDGNSVIYTHTAVPVWATNTVTP
jgi:Alpha-lytic protease prodomain/Trypsin